MSSSSPHSDFVHVCTGSFSGVISRHHLNRVPFDCCKMGRLCSALLSAATFTSAYSARDDVLLCSFRSAEGQYFGISLLAIFPSSISPDGDIFLIVI
jgi:hypothetical protein